MHSEVAQLEKENAKLKAELLALKSRFEAPALGIDDMTGLCTRKAFISIVDRYMHSAPAGTYAIVCLDIGHFREINEQYGFTAGDNVLQKLGLGIKKSIENGYDIAGCRSGSNTFFTLTEAQIDDEKIESFEKWKASEPLDFEVEYYRGVYIIDDLSVPAVQCVDYAAAAMRTAKKKRNRGLETFSRETHKQTLKMRQLVNEARVAFSKEEFVPMYQPLIYVGSNSGNRTFRAEALCRWMRDGKPYAMPDEFIPAFEESNLIFRLDLYMLDKVSAFIRRYIDQYNDDICISVNVSRNTIIHPEFIDRGERIVRKYGIPFKCLDIEITETVVIDEYDRLREIADKIRAFGVKFSIDDFGSLYSSLDVLQKMHFDVLKIDRRFFSSNEDAHRSNIVIGNIIAMAQDLDIEVIAEGIEDKKTVEFLRIVGCDYVQGWVFTGAIPEDELSKWIGFNASDMTGDLTEDETASLRSYNAYFRRNNFNISSKEYEDILRAARIGIWSFEMDEDAPRRLYANDVMEQLIGVEHGTDPEAAYEIFAAGIPATYDEAIETFISKVVDYGMDEIHYPWTAPDGRKVTVRCVGVVDRNYTGNGIRLSGYHQDITQNALEQALDNERKANHIVKAFAEKYYVSYYIDMKSRAYYEIKTTDYLKEDIAPKGDVNKAFSYWINNILNPEFKDIVGNFIDLDSLDRRLKANPDIYVDYINKEGVWSRGRFLPVDYDENGELWHVIYAAQIIEEEKAVELAAKEAAKEAQKANEVLKEQLDIVGAVATISYNTYLLDVDNDDYKILKQQPAVDKYIYEGMGLVRMVGTLLRTLDEESRQNLAPYIENAQKLRAFTKDRDKAVLEYRSIMGVWNRAYLVVIDRNANGEANKLLWLMIDIEDEKRREQAARYRLSLVEKERDLDMPTGLLNKAAVETMIKDTLDANKGEYFALLSIDLDNLKTINDTYGHTQGDAAIKAVAEAMKHCFRDKDVLGRFGGDEFIALLSGVGPDTSLDGKLQQFIETVGKTKLGNNNEWTVSCSVGCAIGKAGEIDFTGLYEKADAALYKTKNSGKHGFISIITD